MSRNHAAGAVIRVGVVDDQALVRSGIRMLLQLENDIEVVAEASDGDQVNALLAEHPDLDVLLLDLRMPRLDGLSVLRSLQHRQATGLPRIVILTAFGSETNAHEAIAAGATGFLLKDATSPELVAAVRAAHLGTTVLAHDAAARLVTHRRTAAPAGGPRDTPLATHLTARERDIVRAVAAAASNSEIASQLHISENTVKSHVARILSKLGLRDRVQLVVAAFRSGLVE